jgi:hypothetical protein
MRLALIGSAVLVIAGVLPWWLEALAFLFVIGTFLWIAVESRTRRQPTDP